MRTACLFWPGSEAEIAGHRPTWYAHFDSKTEATDAVQQARTDDAVALLQLPEETRPHFITIYYDEPDHEGHEFGPDAPQTKAAVLKVDALVGKLKAALDSTRCRSTWWWSAITAWRKEEGPWITLDKLADLTGFEVVGSAAVWQNRRRPRARLQPAQESDVAVCGISTEGCARRA